MRKAHIIYAEYLIFPLFNIFLVVYSILSYQTKILLLSHSGWRQNH